MHMYFRCNARVLCSCTHTYLHARNATCICTMAKHNHYICAVSLAFSKDLHTCPYVHAHVLPLGSIVHVHVHVYTVEPLICIRDTLNKGHLSIKDICFDLMLICIYYIIQPLNKGHLRIKDNFHGPTMSFIQRFHSSCAVTHYAIYTQGSMLTRSLACSGVRMSPSEHTV